MKDYSINQYNFFEKSYGQFNIVKNTEEILKLKPNFISYKKVFENDFSNKKIDSDEISSRYWYTDKGVYRESDHWGYVRSCRWYLNEKNKKTLKGKTIAFCSWKTFKHIVNVENNVFCNYAYAKILQKNYVHITTHDGFYQLFEGYPVSIKNQRFQNVFEIDFAGFIKIDILSKSNFNKKIKKNDS